MKSDDPRCKYWKDQPVTPESMFRNRRQFIKQLAGAGTIAAAGPLLAQDGDEAGLFDLYNIPNNETIKGLLPANKSDKYVLPEGRELTEIRDAFTYNNFYEFSTEKNAHLFTDKYEPFPWELEITGLCNKPRKVDLEMLVKEFPLEERIYRFRCVEAWSMVVPWTGFPLRDLLLKAEPTSEAKYVSFVSLNRPDQMVGQKKYHWYQWPYYEGLRLDEAMNPLTMVTLGSYGRPLPKQCGSPLRIITPWKYGYKGPKAVVKIEFTKDQPHTFWNDSQPKEYGFYSNVEPTKPHPRWSQATERVLGTEDRIETLLYNGYADEVGSLYTGAEF